MVKNRWSLYAQGHYEGRLARTRTAICLPRLKACYALTPQLAHEEL